MCPQVRVWRTCPQIATAFYWAGQKQWSNSDPSALPEKKWAMIVLEESA